MKIKVLQTTGYQLLCEEEIQLHVKLGSRLGFFLQNRSGNKGKFITEVKLKLTLVNRFPFYKSNKLIQRKEVKTKGTKP